MGNVLAIIGEYNPFHNGHLYHIQKSIELTKAQNTILIMSGNYLQRGESALLDKWKRTKMALQNGIDLVIELPVLASISSAENFAHKSIQILDSLKIVDYLSFGSECGSTDILSEFVDVLINEPPEFKALLQHELSKGLSFPKARENALLLYLNDIRKYSNILNSPNNTLGIEYLKALKKLKSNIQPLTIKRTSIEYNSTVPSGNYASSTAIRKMIFNNEFDKLYAIMPQSSYEILNDALRKGEYTRGLYSFEKEIIYKLRCMPREEISNLPSVSEGLDYSIKDAVSNCHTLDELFDKIKSKRYTRTRLNRILLYSLLGYTKDDMDYISNNTPYIRILGFNKSGRSLISEISKKNKKLQLVTSVKQYIDNCKNKKALNLLQKDIKTTDIYTLGYMRNSKANLDYTEKIITL